jgi:subtilisin family serine protease/plastocyanin
MEKEYTVIANTREDLPELEEEITASSGAGPIPNRSVDVANPRPGSRIQTHFMLTDEEAEALRADPRVRAVEIPPEQRDDISIGLNAYQQGTFQRGSGVNSAYVNWGLRRCIEETNTYNNGTTISGDYEYAIDGTGVDVVIQDSGIEANHPEWNDYNGVSRLQQIDWYTASGLAGTQSANHYRDFDGHGTHVASTAAGLKYGWAKGAHVYSQKLGGLEGAGDSGTGIPLADAFDTIRLWHNAKTNGRPTVVNMSWGYGATASGNPTSGVYRGTAWTWGVDYTDRAVLMAATGVSDTIERVYGIVNPALNYFRVPSRVASVDAEVEDMILDGIHVCIAAGNDWHKADISGGPDYNNTVLFSVIGTRSYHQGSSPRSQNAFMVGNIDSTQIFDTTYKDKTAFPSSRGPSVNIWAPGSNILAGTSNINDYTTVSDPTDNNYVITSISGTSMASPQVCGVIAQHLQVFPNLTPAEMQDRIFNDAKSVLYTTGSDIDYELIDESLMGASNRMLYSRYGRQPLNVTTNSKFTLGNTTFTPDGPTYSVVPVANNVDEGSSLTFNVTTTNISDSTTLYWQVIPTNDFVVSSGNFTITSNAGSFTVTPTADTTTEGAETFYAVIYNDSIGGTQVAESGTVTINDTSQAPVLSYDSFTANLSDVNEGGTVTFTVNTSNVINGTTIGYTVSGISASDLSSGSMTGNITINSNTGSVSFTLDNDVTTEGSETLTVTLDATDSAGTSTGGLSDSVTVNDTSQTPGPSYDSLTSSASSINEGDTVTFTVSTSNVINGTTIGYTVSGISASDLSSGSLTGDITINSNTGSVSFTLDNDVTTEGNETLTLTLAATDSASTATGSLNRSVTIIDTSQAPTPTYDVSPAANNVNEGSSLTFNVTTTNVSNGTTLYWTVTNAGDFGTSSGSFTINSDAGSFSVTPTADTTTEGAETFQAQIRTGSTSGTIVDTSTSVTINDTSQTPAFNPDYTITVTNSGNNYLFTGSDRSGSYSNTSQPALSFNSGDKVRFSVSASSHPFYIKTSQSTGTGNQVSGATGQGATMGNVDWTTATDGPGTYGYQCSIHFGMWNTITIS